MKTVTNASGAAVDFDVAVALMDDEPREAIHGTFAPCTEQEFFTAYEKAHQEKYGEHWALSILFIAQSSFSTFYHKVHSL